MIDDIQDKLEDLGYAAAAAAAAIPTPNSWNWIIGSD